MNENIKNIEIGGKRIAIPQERKVLFLSYRSSQVDFAARVFQELDRHCISTWFDKEILHEHVGELYPQIIKEAIDKSELFLLIYTKDIETSTFIIENELEYAIESGKKILVYPKDDVNFDKMSIRLRNSLEKIQWMANDKTSKYISKFKSAIADESKRKTLALSINDLNAHYSDYDDINMFLIRIEVQRWLGLLSPYGTYTNLCNSTMDNMASVYSKDEVGMVVENKLFKIAIPKQYEPKLKELKFMREREDMSASAREVFDLVDSLDPDKTGIRKQLNDFIDRRYSMEEIRKWFKKHHSEVKIGKLVAIDDFIAIVAELTAQDFITEIKKKNKTMFNGAMLGVSGISDDRTQNEENHLLELRLYHSDYFTFKCTVKIYHILRSIEDCFVGINKSNLSEYAPFLCSLGMGGFTVARQNSDTGTDLSLLWAKRSSSISSGDMWHFSFDETVNFVKDVRRDDDGKIVINEMNRITIEPYRNFFRALKEEVGIHENDVAPGSGIMSVGLITSERLEVELLSYAIVDFKPYPSLPEQFRKMQYKAPDGYLEITQVEFIDIADIKRLVGRLLTPESCDLAQNLEANQHLLLPKLYYNLQLGRNVFIAPNAKIGSNCLIEDNSYICERVEIGNSCRIHRNVFIDEGVKIGNHVKIQNNNSVYHGVTLEDGVFVGTNVCFTNDKYPRSVKPDGSLITSGDWELCKTVVEEGASIGAGAVILCGIKIGKWAMVGAGAVVTKDVPAGATVVGNPARIIESKEILK